jgi:hypothetical protein
VAAEGIVFRDSGDRIVPADGMFQLETMPGVAIPMPALFSLAF